VRGRKFREWLRYQYFEKMESGCNAEAMQVAVETIAAKAQYQGDERQVYVRVGAHEGAIYIDLGDEKWKAVEVTNSRWKIIDEPPVRFARSTSTKALRHCLCTDLIEFRAEGTSYPEEQTLRPFIGHLANP
jgi:hypothetical protein